MLTLSKKAQAMPASPIRKLVPFADAAKKRGIKVYHLNIGQPDIESPQEALDAVKNNKLKVVAYAKSGGNDSLREGLSRYYKGIGINVEAADINITNGGSEALQIALSVTCDPDDEVIVLSCDSNVPAGVVPGWNFTCQQLEMKTGTTLFLYTDGLNEAEDIHHNQFGMERMQQTAMNASRTPQQFISVMREEVAKFVGDAEQSDDLTMLAIQYKK